MYSLQFDHVPGAALFKFRTLLRDYYSDSSTIWRAVYIQHYML